MKIIHACLCGPFNVGWGYQENYLANENVKQGFEVTIIASVLINDPASNNLITGPYGEKILDNGIKLIRIPFKYSFLGAINLKLRIYKHLYSVLSGEKPDIIFLHGLQTMELKTINRYQKKFRCKVYADNHADKFNSATGFVSKYILHKGMYKHCINRYIRMFTKIFYISPDSGEFLKNIYKIKENIEFMPLCGTILNTNEISEKRKHIREKHRLDENNFILIHAGKLNEAKKTLETISEFIQTTDLNLRLFVVGEIADSIRQKAMDYIHSDPRIIYVGWKKADELIDYLCASDVFVQIGSQSAIFQQAISCGLALILDDNISQQYLVSRHNGFLVKSPEYLLNILNKIVLNPSIIKEMKKNSYEFAIAELNYKKQSDKYLM